MNSEQLVLSCLMKEQNDGLISKALADGVTKDYFVDPINKIIFDALCQCSIETGGVIDIATVAVKLQESGKYKVIGEWGGLDKIDALTDTASHFNQYLASFCNSAKRNKLNEYLKGAVKRIESAQDPEIIHLVLAEINEMQVQFTKKKNRTMEDVGSDLRKEVTCLINGETPPMGLEWGIDSMSKYANDIEKDELVVIGAAPGRGKTSLAIQIFGHNVDQGRKGAYFSLEMSDKHILRNLIIQKTQIHPNSLKHAYEGDVEKWKNAISDYEANDNVNIFSDCYNIDQIVARTKLMHQSGLDFIVVDYVQLIQSTRGRTTSRAEQLGEITGKLKRLTLDLNIPVITMAQLNRESTKINKFPSMADFRESASIEQDANRVVFVHRPDKTLDNRDQTSAGGFTGPSFDQQLLQRKCRNGPGEVNIWCEFRANIVKFFDKM